MLLVQGAWGKGARARRLRETCQNTAPIASESASSHARTGTLAECSVRVFMVRFATRRAKLLQFILRTHELHRAPPISRGLMSFDSPRKPRSPSSLPSTAMMAASLQFDSPRSPRSPYSRHVGGGPQLLTDRRASDSVSLVHTYGASGRLSSPNTSSSVLRLTPRLGNFRRDSGGVLQTASSLTRSRVIIPPSSTRTCADAHVLDVPPRRVIRSSLPTSFGAANVESAIRLDLATSTRRPSPWGRAVTQTGRTPVALPELRRMCITRSYDVNRDHPSNPSVHPPRHQQLKSRQGMDLCRVYSLGMATRIS